MDAAAHENEVRLRKGTTLNERLVLAGIAIVVCLIALPGLVSSGLADKGPKIDVDKAFREMQRSNAPATPAPDIGASGAAAKPPAELPHCAASA